MKYLLAIGIIISLCACTSRKADVTWPEGEFIRDQLIKNERLLDQQEWRDSHNQYTQPGRINPLWP